LLLLQTMIDVTEALIANLHRRDEAMNVNLAARIAADYDHLAVNELVRLIHEKNKILQSDVIKVLYEIGAKQPALIAPFGETFVSMLSHKDNRLVWGALSALECIVLNNANLIYQHLSVIIEAAEKGSVIATDRAVGILIKLATQSNYTSQSLGLLLDQMYACPTNQLPMYAENALAVVKASTFKEDFRRMMVARLPEIDKASKRTRLEKVIRKLSD
jgi:hypothetical protein